MSLQPQRSTLFPYTTLFRSLQFHFEMTEAALQKMIENGNEELVPGSFIQTAERILNNRNLIENNKGVLFDLLDRLRSEDTRLNSSHVEISYAVFCLKKKKIK